ncbi:MAG: class I SAM-dependent methyltransferase [Thermoguttaceae bacterium]|jgi:ubiquinone/menaquinone biosynthesis C-methylase UbiE
MMDINSIFRGRLLPLAELAGNPDFEGIWVPDDLTPDEIDRSVHAGFRQQARDYVRVYQNTQHFECMLRMAFEKAGFRRQDEPLTILDICSGAGNSVIPLLKMFPRAEVIASDLSVELLAILRQFLVEEGSAGRCTLVQLNAERLEFADASVDLVVGAAALHHLFRPDQTIAECGRILRKGGLAVFFEPFELGVVLMRMLHERIVADPRARKIPREVYSFLQAQIADIDRRLGEDKSDPIFMRLDDKWLFTTHFFQEQSRRHGFARCTTYSLISPERPFEQKMEVLLRAGLGRTREALPAWAWQEIGKHDRSFSPQGHRDCIYEGGILLEK